MTPSAMLLVALALGGGRANLDAFVGLARAPGPGGLLEPG
jgi:hypothetical protein